MVNNKFRGFSLAELLISLLIISIVLAAAIPTMTRKGKGSEQIWRWSMPRNSTYFGTGANQSVIIGSPNPPLQKLISKNGNDVVTDDSELTAFFYDDQIKPNTTTRFSTVGDKLILVKTSIADKDLPNYSSNLINSHISFYNVNGDISSTKNDVSYAGRLAMDKHNIALGIGTLQTLDSTTLASNGFQGNNIAIGHFSLFNDISGIRNVAIGERTLALNINGNDNVALGFMALTNLKAVSENTEEHSQRNTALGSYALIANAGGNDNTAVGANALMTSATGYSNTAIGSSACNDINGSYNICIGADAGAGIIEKDNISEMVAISKKVDHQLIVGSDDYSKIQAGIVNDVKSATRFVDPIIYGVTAYHVKDGKTYDKQLNINAKYFKLNAYDNLRALNVDDTSYVDNNIFTATAEYVNSAYVPGTTGLLKGEFDFVLLNNTKEKIKDTHLLLKRYPDGNKSQVGLYTGTEVANQQYPSDVRDVILNNQLRVAFVEPGNSSSGSVNISTMPESNNALKLAFYVNSSEKSTMMNLADDGFSVSSIIQGKSTPLIHASSSGVSFSSDNVNFFPKNLSASSDPGVIINASTGDIYLKSLKDGQISANVGVALTQLYQMLNPYSDVRLKNVSGDSTAGLKEINALEVKNFTYKDDKEKTPHVGVIAQQLKNVFPNSVIKDKKGYYRIKTEEIFYAMVNSIKELCTQIQTLTAKVAGLDKRITELEKQNQELKKKNAEFEKRLQKLEKSAK